VLVLEEATDVPSRRSSPSLDLDASGRERCGWPVRVRARYARWDVGCTRIYPSSLFHQPIYFLLHIASLAVWFFRGS
jgi:hypothetical protein